MRTSNTETLIIRENIGSETAFTIKATGKAFKILSDGLYTDKVLAIIRELSCNAYDAHVAAGHPELPFDVYLPSVIAPEFRIRDYGTGLDHHQVMHLYTSYFESTKTDSNDFIGALGLGSKSPFSYVDSFIVNSYFNGTKRLYTAFIAEQGVPSITLLGSEPTKEPNGLEITVPVAKTQDFNTFLAKAREVFKYFKTPPNVKAGTAFTLEPLEVIAEGTNWRLLPNARHWETNARALQGNVSYPISPNSFTGDNFTKAQKYAHIFQAALLIDFPIGDLEVTASREALSMDTRTQENILRALPKIDEEAIWQIQQQIEATETRWAARVLLHTIKNKSQYIRQIVNNLGITYRGKDINNSIDVQFKNHPNITVYRWYNYMKKPTRVFKWRGPNAEYSRLFEDSFSMGGDEIPSVSFWIDDVGYAMQKRVSSIRAGTNTYAVSVELPPHVSSRKPDQVAAFVKDNKDIKAFLDVFEGVPTTNVSTIPKLETNRNTVRRTGKFFTFNPSAMLTRDWGNKDGPRTPRTDRLSSTVRDGWSEKEVELKDTQGAPWMEIFKFIPTKYDEDLSKFGLILGLATHLKLMEDTTPLYGVRPKDQLKLKLPDSNEFTAWLRTKCEAELKRRNIIDRVRRNADHQRIQSTVGSEYLNFILARTKTHDVPLLTQFKAEYDKHPYTTLSEDDKHLYELSKLLAIDTIAQSKEADLTIDLAKQILSRYPLFTPLVEFQRNYWNADKIDTKAIDSYINAIDIAYPIALA